MSCLTFNPHDEILYPYIDSVKTYLEAGADSDVNNFEFHFPYMSQPIKLSWTVKCSDFEHFTLETADNPQYKNAEKIILPKDAASYDIEYPLRDTAYYLRLKTVGNETHTASTSFRTPYPGPRCFRLGGKYNNIRDIGGYKMTGGITRYSNIIRGSSPDDCVNPDSMLITPEGKEYLENRIGIKTQIDLREKTENCGRTASSFRNAAYYNFPIIGYMGAYLPEQKELYRDLFRMFANPDNYPIYIHCAGGADRTGTVMALLEALLGVDRGEIVTDYVLTTFSPVCFQQKARTKDNINPVIDGLNNYDGSALSEKCETYMKSLGLTDEEINNIRTYNSN